MALPILPFITFAKSYWKFFAVAVIVAAIAWYHHSLVSEIADQKATISDQKTQIDTLARSLQEQNDAVDQMKADADAREIAGAAAITAAKQQALVYKQRADALRKTQPKFPADLCRSADDLINQELSK